MLDITVYGTQCTTTEFYKSFLEEFLMREQVAATFEIVQDVDAINKMGLDIGCMFGYCPGCNKAHDDKKENERYVPALVVNDDIIFHSFFPNKDQLSEILEKLKRLEKLK